MTLVAEEQVLGIAMANKGEKGMSGLRAISSEEFLARPVHRVVAEAITELSDRKYSHNANAVSKLLTIRRQPVPWDFQGPLRQLPDGRQGPQPTSAYLRQLQQNAQPYETSLGFATQVRATFRSDYAAKTGQLAQQLGAELQQTALIGVDNSWPWDVTKQLEHLQTKIQERVALCPPSLEPLLQNSVGHDRLQKTLTAARSLPHTRTSPRPSLSRATR